MYTYIQLEFCARLPVSRRWCRIPLYGQQAPWKPCMLSIGGPVVELLEGVEIFPAQVTQALPDPDGEVMEPDIEGWDRGLLMQGFRCAKVVPSGV